MVVLCGLFIYLFLTLQGHLRVVNLLNVSVTVSSEPDSVSLFVSQQTQSLYEDVGAFCILPDH